MDGSVETVEARTLWWAWFKGRVRAREKKTYLLKVVPEEVYEMPVIDKVTPCDVCGNVELNWDRDWAVCDEEWLQVVPERWRDSTLCPWCFKKFALQLGKEYNVVFYDDVAVGVERVDTSRSHMEKVELSRKEYSAIVAPELEMAKVEATEYINGLLEEYVVRTLDVEIPPLWDFGPVWPPMYYPSVKKILVPEPVVVLWAKDRDKTKLALRWAIGHEFWHYVQQVRGERGFPVLSFPRIAQRIAEKQAVRLSGITTVEGERTWEELLLEAGIYG